MLILDESSATMQESQEESRQDKHQAEVSGLEKSEFIPNGSTPEFGRVKFIIQEV